MRGFWPYFFGFILILILFIWVVQRDAFTGALFFLGTWFMLLLWVVLAGVVGSLLVVAYAFYAKLQDRSRRPVDGAYPLQQFRMRGGKTVIINPTHMIGAAAVVDRRTGSYTELEHPAGWAAMREIRRDVERSNSIRAMFPGDAARMNQNGAISRMPSAAGLGALNKLTPAPRIVGAEEDRQLTAALPVGRVLLTEAIQRADGTTLPVGQSLEGPVVSWDLDQYPHARFHGASQGSGKTNAARTALLAMARAGAHVVILDRRRFKDFREFDGRAELIATNDPRTFVQAMKRLEEIYLKRDRMLGSYGAGNIGELPQKVVRYVVMVTEFGALCSVANDEGVLRDAMGPLSRIMREAGATGIHLIFEDQIVEKGIWPRGVAANAGAVFTGYLPLNMGAAGGYHHAHQLERYQFHHDGAILRTWDTKPHARQLLATAPAYDDRFALMAGGAVDGERSFASDPAPLTPGERANERPNEQADEQTDEPSNKWQDVTIDFFSARPQLLTGPARGISDLAKCMAAADGNEKPYTAYKGIAHTYYHDFRNSVKLPGGQRLGIDVTN